MARNKHPIPHPPRTPVLGDARTVDGDAPIQDLMRISREPGSSCAMRSVSTRPWAVRYAACACWAAMRCSPPRRRSPLAADNRYVPDVWTGS